MKKTKSSCESDDKKPGSSEPEMAGVGIRELLRHDDWRGWLAEAWRSDGPERRKPAMMYVSCTNKGVARGPHEHARQTDAFVFLGRFQVALWDDRERSRTRGCRKVFCTRAGRPTLVVVPPGVVHAYRSLQAGGMVLNMPDKLYGGKGGKGKVDEIRHEHDMGSPYRFL